MSKQLLGILVILLVMCGAASAAQPAPAEPADGPTAQEIEQWVRDLSADQYYVRDAATRHLIAAGPAAVDAVAKALVGGDLELTTRGIFILQELALLGDLETEETARVALERLAAARVTAAARRASDALVALEEAKQEQALAQLERLGAKVDPQHVEEGLTLARVLAVEIGAAWRGQEGDLRRLKWLRDVEQVTFIGERVTDRWIAHIQGMQNLATLKIKRATITRAALDPLSELPQLQNVKLLYVPLGDDAVAPLIQCPQISKVLAYGTRLTSDGAQQLEARGVEVDVRRGAFLGISVPKTNEGATWAIDRVTENSAAAKAGIQPGDVIVKYGGRDVHDFVSLMGMIAENDAGDAVTIHVRRGEEILVKEITFGEWQ